MIKKILKAVLPATYRKIGKSEQKILDALIEQNSLFRTEIANLNRRIDSLESTLLQKIQDEANWKRADIVNDMRPLLAEVKQTVENESNWKRDELARNIEENKNLLRLLDFAQENMFYAMYKKDGESEIDAKKRFFKSLPEATGGLRLLQKGNSVLLQQFDKICKKFDLPYFFCGGNLVGAVRTGSQVPWDDDIDVIMLRHDIKKLASALEGNKDFRITVLFDWWGKCKQIRFRFKNEKIPVFLDIFIYDVYKGEYKDNPESYNHIEMVKFLEATDLPEVQYWKKHPYLYDSDEHFTAIEKIFNRFSLHSNAIVDNFENYPIKTILRSSENVNAYPHHRFYKYEQFFPCKKISFEGYEYLVPNDYMGFLKDNYGDVFKLPLDIFTHFEHIPHNELESEEFKQMIETLLELYGQKNQGDSL